MEMSSTHEIINDKIYRVFKNSCECAQDIFIFDEFSNLIVKYLLFLSRKFQYILNEIIHILNEKFFTLVHSFMIFIISHFKTVYEN